MKISMLIMTFVSIIIVFSVLTGCYETKSLSNTVCPDLITPKNVEIEVKGKDAQGKSMIIFHTDDSSESIRLFYKETLLRLGWEIESETNSAITFIYKKDEDHIPCQVDVITNKLPSGQTEVVVGEPTVPM